MARVYPLFSGSSGNCYYVGSKNAGILIDAGRSAKQIGQALELCGLDPLAVQGIFVTHEHTDHVSGLRVFASKYRIPVFASGGTVSSLEQGGIANGSFPIHALTGDTQIADMTVEYFSTPHDCAQSLGYRVKTADKKCLAFATDLGHVSPEVENGVLGSDFAVIESNHDIAMLQNGGYPYILKRRILSQEGHLSNRDCSEFVTRLIKSGVKKFMLAHISHENNTADIAYESTLCAATLAGYVKDVDFSLCVAPRANETGKAVIF